jgi:hypothetical protein
VAKFLIAGEPAEYRGSGLASAVRAVVWFVATSMSFSQLLRPVTLDLLNHSAVYELTHGTPQGCERAKRLCGHRVVFPTARCFHLGLRRLEGTS